MREVGAEWLCLQAVRELGIAGFLQSKGWNKEATCTAITDLISRAVYPASEYKTSAWIESSSAVSSLVFGTHQSISYQRLYRISDKLYEEKESLEQHLYTTTKGLFNLQDKIILYDLTNTYFEGRKASSKIAKFGRSKEKRSDAKLVSLAVVVNTDGFVKYSKIYEGNIGETKTLEAMVDSLAPYATPGIKNPIVVMDAGIATEENLTMLKEKKYDFLCVTRTKLKDYKVADEKKQRVVVEDNRKRKIALQRITVEGKTDTFMYVRSELKAVKEASMEAHFSERYEQELEKLNQSVQKKGGVKNITKVHERLGRIKERYPAANRHYTIHVENEGDRAILLTFSRKIAQAEATARQGVYFIRTSLQLDQETDIWDIYHTLTEVESGFRILKTDLSIRPIFHQKDKRTESHIFLGVLAFSLVNTIRYRLKAKGIHHDWRNIIRIMNTQKIVTTSVKNDQGKVITIEKCSQSTEEVAAIYQAMNYKSAPFTMKKFVLPQ
ncbi:MAG TPA: IS1634 family transposase [Hanamia sp.]|nr:IS1634 family transposase [Hanamia sp.]